jgi:hypothetical protein
MKQFKIAIPKKLAEQFAAYSLTAKIRIIQSWQEGDGDFFGFDEPKIVSICAIEDADLEAFQKSDWAKYLKQ